MDNLLFKYNAQMQQLFDKYQIFSIESWTIKELLINKNIKILVYVSVEHS